MGLDMYLFARTKESYDAIKAYKEIVAKANEECEKVFKEKWLNFYITLPKFPISKELDFDKFTLEQDRFCDEFKREYKEIRKKYGIKYDSDGYEIVPMSEEPDELGYWRKSYNLHNFLVKKFGVEGDGSWNTNIYLTQENIDYIIEELGKKPFSVEEYDDWDDNSYEYTISAFKKALRFAKAGFVIYYHPWG